MKSEFNLEKELNVFLGKVKEEIVRCLILIYKNKHNGLLPNWDKGEEIVISANDINEHITFSCDFIIEKCIVTLDENLFFRVVNNDEYEWDELSINDILIICEKIQNVVETLT
jgi:hypothetical protein